MEYTIQQIKDLLGSECYTMYERLDHYITDNYNVDQLWEKAGKFGVVGLRYNRGGKTLCTLFFRQGQLGIWIIFGKEERSKFEETQENFSAQVREKYENTKTYHDGKWLMFDVEDASLLPDMKRLLQIKKKPNRKLTMCGYCCDMCKAFQGNIRKKDERECLSGYWQKYYELNIPIEEIRCDGCRCRKADAHRIDSECPVRACVLEKQLSDCSECAQYPCETFMARKGLSHSEADAISELDVKNYYTYLSAFDNKSRCDRRHTGAK